MIFGYTIYLDRIFTTSRRDVAGMMEYINLDILVWVCLNMSSTSFWWPFHPQNIGSHQYQNRGFKKKHQWVSVVVPPKNGSPTLSEKKKHTLASWGGQVSTRRPLQYSKACLFTEHLWWYLGISWMSTIPVHTRIMFFFLVLACHGPSLFIDLLQGQCQTMSNPDSIHKLWV